MEALNYTVMLLFGGIILYVAIRPFLPAYRTRKRKAKVTMHIGHGVELMSKVKHNSFYFVDHAELDGEEGILTFYTKKEEVVKLHFDDGIPFIPENLYAARFKLNGKISFIYYDFDEVNPDED